MAAKKSTDFSESLVWKVISFTGNAIMLNLLFLVSCLPIGATAVLRVIWGKNILIKILFYASFFCLGPALCGLFSAIRYHLRKDGWFDGYKAGYKTKWWQMAIISTVCSAAIFYMSDTVITISKQVAASYSGKGLGTLIPNALILAVPLMFFTSAVVYNVFFPRRMIDLLTESASFVFKAPLQLLITGAILWAPLVFMIAFSKYIIVFAIVFMALYFSLAAIIGIGMLKDPLIVVLSSKRESGELPPARTDDEDEE